MRTLGYATQTLPAADPLRFVCISRVLALFAAGVAVLLMLGTWLTGSFLVGFVGFLWLFGGGGLTLLAFSFALADCCYAWLAMENRRRHLLRAGISMTIILLNVPLAWVCSYLGQLLISFRH